MNIAEKMELAVKYNKAYRNGDELVSDAAYDLLLEEIQKELKWDEFIEFKESLTETSGDVKFDYVIGSLEKLKSDEPDKFWKWIKKNNIKNLFASLKIDGCSWYAEYRNGNLKKVTSRGDGESGVDWTDKAMKIPSIPKTISYLEPTDVRGEFTLTDNSHEHLSFKNRRNGTVGLMNRDVVSENIHMVEAFAYQVLSDNLNVVEQFNFLKVQGFQTPEHCIFSVGESLIDRMEAYYLNSKDEAQYDIDGLVISDSEWKNENDKFLPERKSAFKVNSDFTETTILGYEWNLSKERKLKPVALVNPVDIDGSTISRCTGNNAQWILDRGLGIGARVGIIKSGCVIPKIIEIIETSAVALPNKCPECGEVLGWDGVDLQCPNLECGEVKRVESFIKSIGIENVSESSLLNWNVTSFDALLSWCPDVSYKSQNDFHVALQEKVYETTAENIMRHLPYNGLGTTLFDSLLNHVGSLESMKITFENPNTTSLPSGIGVRTLEKAKLSFDVNWGIKERIINSVRYKKPEPKEEVVIVDGILSGKKVLFTGSFSQKKAKLEARCVELGATIVDSVNKNLDILFCAEDSWDKSNKYTKAQKLGVEIKTEEQMWNLIK